MNLRITGGLHLQTLINWDFLCLGSASSAPAASPRSTATASGPGDHRDCEDYGIDPDRPDSPLSGDGIDLALAGLMKGL